VKSPDSGQRRTVIAAQTRGERSCASFHLVPHIFPLIAALAGRRASTGDIDARAASRSVLLGSG